MRFHGEFHCRSVTISLSNIAYTWNVNPAYCIGFDVYLGMAKTRLIINPQDNSTYSHHAWLSARNEFSVTITENEPGWCNNCIFGVAIRTTNMTSWRINAHLNYGGFFSSFLLTHSRDPSAARRSASRLDYPVYWRYSLLVLPPPDRLPTHLHPRYAPPVRR